MQVRGFSRRRFLQMLGVGALGTFFAFQGGSRSALDQGKQNPQPLVVTNGNVADATAMVLGGPEQVTWQGKFVIGLAGCGAYQAERQGLLFRVDDTVPEVPATEVYPSPGIHQIEWVAVDQTGQPLLPPVLSFGAEFRP